ncbi:complement component C1q receptor [Sorex araneus]|uniref:complement component C1q receptor n=1 Tax=Sorex araneus TaxID=42254 RepID=UPI0024336D64|nr:complement component C1q receptor [Sorex araneus]
MATSCCLLLLLLLVQPWAGTSADKEAVVCAEAACYTAHWGKLTAAQAQDHCSQNGGNLASVRNEEEARHIQQALGQLLKSEALLETRIGKFWIGLQREKGKCLDPDLPLKGFSWLGGGAHTDYTNWHKELRGSCVSKRCVSLLLDLSLPPQASRLPKWSEGPCGSPGSPGSNIEGFVCKFSFKGMCRPLTLGGPGHVNYTTPFQTTSSNLEAVPFASVANVVCGDEDSENVLSYFICKEKEPDVFHWGNSGPLCVSSKYGCNFNNGGCQQDCFEGGDGSFRCGCRPGFRLLDDLVTCASRNPCSSNPCRGKATCRPEPHGENYMCLCPEGYQLDFSQRDCVDVNECESGSSCSQDCINTLGSFQCHCWIGYEPIDIEHVTCEDVDECATNNSLCIQGCVNTEGSFYCTCQEGYVQGNDSQQCVDVDECTSPEATQKCDSLCINTQGSFHCACHPGWELASDGFSCKMISVSPGLLAGTSQDMGGRDSSSVPPAMVFSSTKDPELTSTVAPSTTKLSLPPRVHTTSAAPETLTRTGLPDFWMEPNSHDPTAIPGHEEPTGGDVVAKHSDEEGTDGQKLLLFYILGSVVAILLLLALALGLLVYRKRRARREEIKEKKPQSATDTYSWVPERPEKRAKENQYSPTPGRDC